MYYGAVSALDSDFCARRAAARAWSDGAATLSTEPTGNTKSALRCATPVTGSMAHKCSFTIATQSLVNALAFAPDAWVPLQRCAAAWKSPQTRSASMPMLVR